MGGAVPSPISYVTSCFSDARFFNWSRLGAWVAFQNKLRRTGKIQRSEPEGVLFQRLQRGFDLLRMLCRFRLKRGPSNLAVFDDK